MRGPPRAHARRTGAAGGGIACGVQARTRPRRDYVHHAGLSRAAPAASGGRYAAGAVIGNRPLAGGAGSVPAPWRRGGENRREARVRGRRRVNLALPPFLSIVPRGRPLPWFVVRAAPLLSGAVEPEVTRREMQAPGSARWRRPYWRHLRPRVAARPDPLRVAGELTPPACESLARLGRAASDPNRSRSARCRVRRHPLPLAAAHYTACPRLRPKVADYCVWGRWPDRPARALPRRACSALDAAPRRDAPGISASTPARFQVAPRPLPGRSQAANTFHQQQVLSRGTVATNPVLS